MSFLNIPIKNDIDISIDVVTGKFASFQLRYPIKCATIELSINPTFSH